MFAVTNKSGTKFAAVSIPNTRCIRIGNYTVGPLNAGWTVFDWTRDIDIKVHDSRIAALAYARALVERSTRQDAAAVTA